MAEAVADQPGPVRAGEELDTERLRAYLVHVIPGLSGPLTLEQFPSGYSNLTYLIRAGDREFVLRRPPSGVHIKTAHDMSREYRILSSLRPVYPRVPRPLAYWEDAAVLGAPFYIMERVRGVILRTSIPDGLTVLPAQMRCLSESFIDTLADLHVLDYRGAGLADLGRPEGYIERQVRGWRQRYQNARTDDVPSVERVAAWLDAHRPTERSAALIHNDYKYDNLVLDPQDLSHIVAVLDWEMATIGDPLMDLGTTLGYWIEPDDPDAWVRAGLTTLTTHQGNLRRAELAERYAQRTGQDLPHMVFYYVYGLFKIAVIIQQIYMRFKKGLSRDPRFAHLLDVVAACGAVATLAIEKQRVDHLS